VCWRKRVSAVIYARLSVGAAVAEYGHGSRVDGSHVLGRHRSSHAIDFSGASEKYAKWHMRGGGLVCTLVQASSIGIGRESLPARELLREIAQAHLHEEV
jgi:hypothetical protein